MKPIRYFVCAFLCFAAFSAFSQNVLSGKITDTLSQKPLEGAVVYIVDLKVASQAGPDGVYTLNKLPKGTFLVEVHLLGYATKTASVHVEGNTTLNIALSAEYFEEDEVVITGTSSKY